MDKSVEYKSVATMARLDVAQGNPLLSERRRALSEQTYFGNDVADARDQMYEVLGEYDRNWHRANVKDDFKPKIAVLQVKPEASSVKFAGHDYLQSRGMEAEVGNYNLVHVRPFENPVLDSRDENSQLTICRDLYRELNNGNQHPYNFFGHSLSVSDVVVIRSDFNTYAAYFVDRFGYTKLPDDFLSREMKSKISLDMDVYQERNALAEVLEYQEERGNGKAFLSDEDKARLQSLSDYLRPIEQLRRARYIGDPHFPEVILSELAYDGEGYLHFTAEVKGNSLDGLFRVYDPANGKEMEIVSVEYGDRYDEITYHWDEMEAALREVAQGKYNDLTAHLLKPDSRYATLAHTEGQWRVVEAQRIDGMNLFLMEREDNEDNPIPAERRAKERIVADENATPRLWNVENFQQYVSLVSEPMHVAVVRAMEAEGWVHNQNVTDLGSEQVGFQRGGTMDRPDEITRFANWQMAASFVRERRPPLVPIQEVKDSRGRATLAGSEIGRGNVYHAVRLFEQANLVERPVIDPMGNYDDKDFLYSAYDEYVAMSHYNELWGYRAYFAETVLAEYNRMKEYGYNPDMERLYNTRLAEVYYAKQSGMSENMIAGIIGDGSRSPDQMRQFRNLIADGYTQAQVDALARLTQHFTVEYAADYLRNGGSVNLINRIPENTDMTTAYFTFDALSNGEISVDAAAGIFEASQNIRDFTEREYVKALEAGQRAEYRFSGIDFEFLATGMIQMVRENNLDGASILATVNKWLEDGANGWLAEQPIVRPDERQDLIGRKFDYQGNIWEVISADSKQIYLNDVNTSDNHMEISVERFTAEFLENPAVRDVTDEKADREKTLDYVSVQGREALVHYLANGGDVRILDAIPEELPRYGDYPIFRELDEGNIDVYTAASLLQGLEEIKAWNDREHAQRERQYGKTDRYRISELGFVSVATEMTQMAREHGGDVTLATVRGWLNSGATEPLAFHPIERTDGMTVERAKIRIAEIEAEQQEMADRQYQYGIMVDKMYNARLYQEKRGLEAFLKENDKSYHGEDRVMVAIESTEDYTEPGFHSELVDIDIMNEDGTFGKVIHSYRVVTIGEDSSLTPLNNQVFRGSDVYQSFNEALATVMGDPRYNIVSYDDIVHEAMDRRMAAMGRQQPDLQTAQAEAERLYRIGERFLHIQRTDDGWDYTIYDANRNVVDGGQLDRPELDIMTAYGEVCALQGIVPAVGVIVPLSLLEEKTEVQRLWDMVNSVETREDIAEAIKVLENADIDVATFDEMMQALSFLSREIYQRERDATTPAIAEREEATEKANPPAEVKEEDSNLTPKERLQQQLENGVRGVMNSEGFRNWLSTSSRMFTRQYSFQNAMLVWLQKPDATYTMGYEAWKDYGRNVQQGAQGAKIFVPLMAYEKTKGALFAQVKKGLTEQLAADSSAQVVSYRLGTSKLEFTLNRSNHLYGVRMDGKDRGQLGGEAEVKRFIERSVLGKVPYGFTVGTVFDVKDVTIPEHLWVKKGYTKDEVVKDEKGRPVKNRKGEVKIINTPERQAKFQPHLNTSIVAKDPQKMALLFNALVAASERKGIPVYLRNKETDETLRGGASGYFSREFSSIAPKGFIVMDENLEITERCSVMMHEMAHADLHGNLEALNQSMGEKVNRGMREVQAEACAFATASQFGITTDTSSFAYLAVYSSGYQLQEFQKSLEVIYKEAKALTADIKAELDVRGLNMDLTEKDMQPLEAESVKLLCAKYIDFAMEQEQKIGDVTAEIPSLLDQAKDSPDLLDILRYQNENIENRKEDVEAIIAGVEGLNQAETREQQQMQLDVLEAAVVRVRQSNDQFNSLTEQFITTSERLKGGLKAEFDKAPKETIEKLSGDYPKLKDLSPAQLDYVSTSKFVASQYSKLLRNAPEQFVEKVCDRANAISEVSAKNGTFVEVNFCEQWTDKPIFENGTICHPKIADKIIAGSEAQIQGFKREAEKNNDYFPYSKCDLTVYAHTENGLKGWATRIDIGNGGQKGLTDHLERCAGRSKPKGEILQKFTEATAERGPYKNKQFIPSVEAAKAQQAAEKTKGQEKKKTVRVSQRESDWQQQIASAKEQGREDSQGKSEQEHHQNRKERR